MNLYDESYDERISKSEAVSRSKGSGEVAEDTAAKDTIRVLLVPVNDYPRPIDIGCELEPLQKAVGGNIEVTYPFEDQAGIVLNEEGKLMGLPLNRAVYTENGDLYDIYAGDFLVVGLGEEDFCSLTPEQMKTYEQRFHQPEMFVKMGRGVIATAIPDDMVRSMRDRSAKSKSAPEQTNPNHDVPAL